MTDKNKAQRLRYRSWHRGTREMDLLLGHFADAHMADFTMAQLDQYEAILQCADPDLYHWISGSEPVPPQHDSEVMRLLRAHKFASSSAILRVAS